MNYKTLIFGLIVVFALLVPSVNAMKLPSAYKLKQCELIANDYQKEFGGSLVWIQSIDRNGALIFGDYTAHILNRAYNQERGIYYVDWYSQKYFNNTKEIHDWYKEISNRENYVFDLAIERPQFGMGWNYD